MRNLRIDVDILRNLRICILKQTVFKQIYYTIRIHLIIVFYFIFDLFAYFKRNAYLCIVYEGFKSK